MSVTATPIQAPAQTRHLAPRPSASTKSTGTLTLIPPHLALTGQSTAGEGQIDPTDLKLIGTERKALANLLSFGVKHDLVEHAAVRNLLNAPLIEQGVYAREALHSLNAGLGNALPHCFGAYKLLLREPDAMTECGGALGVYVAPTELRTFLRINVPDPVLEDWLARFARSCAHTLGWVRATELLESEVDITVCDLGFDLATVRTLKDQARALLEAEKTAEALELLDYTNSYGFTVEEAEWHLYRLLDVIDDIPHKEGEVESLRVLSMELESLLDRWPRFRYEPLIKLLTESLPSLIAGATYLNTDWERRPLEDNGDYYVGAHFVVVDREVSDSGCEVIDETTNHMYEVGDYGHFKLDLSAPNAFEYCSIYFQFAGSFLALCDDRGIKSEEQTRDGD